MQGIIGPCVLWPFDKKLIFWLVTHITTRDYTVTKYEEINQGLNYVNIMVQSMQEHFITLWKKADIGLDWMNCHQTSSW